VIIVAHGLVSSGLFALVNVIYQIVQTRRLFLTKGIIRVVPVISFLWFVMLRANMGVPPSINLQGEVILVRSILSISGGFILPMAISLFLSAAYCLHLFSSTQHGRIRQVVGLFVNISMRGVVLVVLHLLPVFLFIIKTEVITC